MNKLNQANTNTDYSSQMMELATRLWPINRSITGEGFRQSLSIIEDFIDSKFNQLKFKTGEKVLDWEIPNEWGISEGYILDPEGNKFCDFQQNNLSVMGYSSPVDKTLTLEALQEHLFSLPEQPNAIPYVTSYYKENWGFCISQKERDSLKNGNYLARIKSELKPGELVVGEILFQGQVSEEVFISTYLCHPSMANNELSGPIVTAQLIKFISSIENRKYTYRIVFVPETIGSIAYLSRNYRELKSKVVAGFNITCVGDDRAYSYLPTRNGSTLSDKVATHVLRQLDPNFRRYTWLDRGSDERQYCAPGIDLPIASIMRSKYGEYPEYHTSLDRLGTVVTEEGLMGGYHALENAIRILELNNIFMTTSLGEPRLDKFNLYPTTSIKNGYGARTKLISNIITYSDGNRDCIDLGEIFDVSALEIANISAELERLGILIKRNDRKAT